MGWRESVLKWGGSLRVGDFDSLIVPPGYYESYERSEE